MKNSSNQPDPWKPCEPGTIDAVKFSAPVAAVAGRRDFLKTVGGGTAVLALTTYAGWTIFGRDEANPDNADGGNVIKSMSCADCCDNLPDYVVGKLIDQSLNCQMREHLRICKHCHGELKKLTKA
jgi:hypothetical protein